MDREFINEIGMISALQHPCLVKLYACCMEGDQLLLIYEYMENNSLAHSLFGNFFLLKQQLVGVSIILYDLVHDTYTSLYHTICLILCMPGKNDGTEKCQLKLDWSTRQKICVGVARGLAYLHEESRLKVAHRDIKASNVLLDKDLHPKISDFGLAKLEEEDKTHISTKVAGT